MGFINTTPFDIRSIKTSKSPKNSDFKENGIDRVTTIQFGNELDWSHVSSLYHKQHPDKHIEKLDGRRLAIPVPDGIIEKAIPDYLLGEFSKYPATPKLPYNIFVKLAIDTTEIDEPNMGSVQFYSDEPNEKKFRQKVRDAIKEWIETDPDDYLASEADTGNASLDNVDPSDKDFKEQALEAGATWDMVYSDLPDEIALKHGFFAMPFHTTFDDNESDKV